MQASAAYGRDAPNPLDRIESVAETLSWPFERAADDEVNLTADMAWGSLRLCLNWRADLEVLHVACFGEAKVQPPRREETSRLVGLINEQLYSGHFDLWRGDGSIVYRNGLILAGGADATEQQCEALIRLAVEVSERYYPAFQFVNWAGSGAEAALTASMVETLGEA